MPVRETKQSNKVELTENNYWLASRFCSPSSTMSITDTKKSKLQVDQYNNDQASDNVQSGFSMLNCTICKPDQVQEEATGNNRHPPWEASLLHDAKTLDQMPYQLQKGHETQLGMLFGPVNETGNKYKRSCGCNTSQVLNNKDTNLNPPMVPRIILSSSEHNKNQQNHMIELVAD